MGSAKTGCVLLLVTVLLLVGATANAQPAETPRQLSQEERNNQQAQADYYRAQTAKLTKDSANFWTDVGAVATPLGASAAAIIAILSLFVNSRQDRRNRRDTQFTETLKNLSDTEKPTLRSASAGTLAQIARPHGFSTRNAYVAPAIEQLCSSIASEENPVVLLSVHNALVRVGHYDSWTALERLNQVGFLIRRTLGSLMRSKIGHLTGRSGSPIDASYRMDDFTISDSELDMLAKLDGLNEFERPALKELALNPISLAHIEFKPTNLDQELVYWSHRLRVVAEASSAIWRASTLARLLHNRAGHRLVCAIHC